MKKVVKYLSIIICTFIISISYVKATSYDVWVTSTTMVVGNSITLTIKGNDLTGRINLSSNSSNISLEKSNVWIENNSQSITITAKSAGTATITFIPEEGMSNNNGDPVSLGNKTVTITVNSKPTSNPSNGGHKTGTTTTPKPTKKKSSNNNLSSLTIEDYNLDKEFKKEVTEYSVVVENDVKKIKINAQLDDSSAKVTGIGEVEVKEGINKLEIKVTAENGSTRTYTLNVTVKELNPIEVTINKKKYTIIRKEGELEPPENYEKSSIKIGEEEVLCYINKNTKNIIIGLTDEKGVSKFYSYNEKTKEYTLYNGYNIGGMNINILEMPEELIPKGYIKVSFNYNNNKLDGYQYIKKNQTYAADDKIKGSDFYLIYGINEKTGEKTLYVYDKLEGTIQRFNSDLVEAYNDENNKYFMYMLISLALLAVSIIALSIVLIKQKKNKTKFA